MWQQAFIVSKKSSNKVTFSNQRHQHESETRFCYEAARLLFRMFIFVLSETAKCYYLTPLSVMSVKHSVPHVLFHE